MSKTIKIEEIVKIIEQSNLDETIKQILIRDLKSEGLSEFLRDQIIAYCDKAVGIIDKLQHESKSQPD